MAAMLWPSFRRSLLRGVIALIVFLTVGAVDVLVRPTVPAAGSALPWFGFAMATVATLVLWRLVLPWSFVLEHEPRLVIESQVGDVTFLTATADHFVGVQVPAFAFAAVVICSAAPVTAVQSRAQVAESTKSCSSNVSAVRVRL